VDYSSSRPASRISAQQIINAGNNIISGYQKIKFRQADLTRHLIKYQQIVDASGLAVVTAWMEIRLSF
jgi:hypothetical protein